MPMKYLLLIPLFIIGCDVSTPHTAVIENRRNIKELIGLVAEGVKQDSIMMSQHIRLQKQVLRLQNVVIAQQEWINNHKCQ